MKIVTKNVSCEFKCKFDRRKCNWNENWNIDKCRCECRKHRICEKDYILNPTTCSWKNAKYLGSIIYDSVITCDRIIELFRQKLFQQKVIEKVSIFYSSFS